jgi:hypothetical protein
LAVPLFSADDAAQLADIKPAQLRLWLDTGAFTTGSYATSKHAFGGGTAIEYLFTEEDVKRLKAFATKQVLRRASKKEQFVDDGTLETFTVAQIASMWQFSTDTVQRLFLDEPGVQIQGDKNPRGKRPRVTLRIPREVMERVRRRRSNIGCP